MELKTVPHPPFSSVIAWGTQLLMREAAPSVHSNDFGRGMGFNSLLMANI